MPPAAASRWLMSYVAQEDHQRLDEYSNYDLAVLTPVLFPLSFALLAVVYGLYRIIFTARNAHPTARLIAAAVTTAEGFFAFFCWGSCVANYAKLGYSGGLSACDFQGFYSGFYVFSQPLFITVAAVVTAMAQAQREFVSWLPVCVVLALISVFALIVAALPFMGETHYHFAKDFCLFDIEDDAVGAMFLMLFVATTVIMAVTSVRLINTQVWWLYPVLLAFFLWGFLSLLVIVLKDWAGDLDSDQTVWGWMAILLHTQQLANPLLYSMLWLPKVVELTEKCEEVDQTDCTKVGEKISEKEECVNSDTIVKIK